MTCPTNCTQCTASAAIRELSGKLTEHDALLDALELMKTREQYPAF